MRGPAGHWCGFRLQRDRSATRCWPSFTNPSRSRHWAFPVFQPAPTPPHAKGMQPLTSTFVQVEFVLERIVINAFDLCCTEEHFVTCWDAAGSEASLNDCKFSPVRKLRHFRSPPPESGRFPLARPSPFPSSAFGHERCSKIGACGWLRAGGPARGR